MRPLCFAASGLLAAAAALAAPAFRGAITGGKLRARASPRHSDSRKLLVLLQTCASQRATSTRHM